MKIIKGSRSTIDGFLSALEDRIDELSQVDSATNTSGIPAKPEFEDVENCDSVMSSEYKGYNIQETQSECLIRDAKGKVVMKVPAYEEALEWVDENAVESCDSVMSSAELQPIVEEVCAFLAARGYDMDDPGNQNYAEAAAEYISYARMDDNKYSVRDWWSDTSTNMPEDLEQLAVKAAEDPTANERFLHTLIGDLQSELEGEIDGMNSKYDDDTLDIVVIDGENQIELSVPLKDLTMNFDTIDKDVKYIADSVRESIGG